MSTKKVEKALKAYQGWIARYKPKHYEATSENIAFIAGIDERYVWTFIADTLAQHVSNGFWNNNAFDFYVSEVAWGGKAGNENYYVEVRDTCDECSGTGSNCNEFEVSGEKVYFVD